MMASTTEQPDGLAPLISVVGTDGSGKTTVSSEVLNFVRQYGDAETAHLGLRSGDIGRAIKNFRFGGAWADAIISRKAGQARTKGDRIPGAGTAAIIYVFSLFRILRFKRMMSLRRKGILIVTDRYPQLDVPGFYDGPGLSAARAEGWFVRWLSERERRQYEWMASFRPNLVIRLNVDVDTAFARKPDHNFNSLKQKVEATPKLRFGGAPIVDIDSRLPLEAVLSSARHAIAETMSKLGRHATAS
jgi:thymidylate kinase